MKWAGFSAAKIKGKIKIPRFITGNGSKGCASCTISITIAAVAIATTAAGVSSTEIQTHFAVFAVVAIIGP